MKSEYDEGQSDDMQSIDFVVFSMSLSFGINPKNIDDPVGGLVNEFLCCMLKPKPGDRPTASDLIDSWETVMKESMKALTES